MLRIGALDVPDGAFVLMAIVNRTPDSFYDRGATYAMASALDRVDRVVAEGADMVDVGGVKAAPGDEVDAAEAGERPADEEGARLIALNMALNGTPRDETARYLSQNFELDDQDALLDEVYARVGG